MSDTTVPDRRYRFEGKALSIVQPFASAIAFAGKSFENRSRQTHYRGPVAIHASQKIWQDELEHPQRVERGSVKHTLVDWINRGRKKYGLELEDKPITGHIIAIAMLDDCITNQLRLGFKVTGDGYSNALCLLNRSLSKAI